MLHMRATDDDVLDILEGSAPHGCGHGQPPRGNAPSPPLRPSISLEQLLATQNELMTLLMQNEAHCGAEHLQHPQHQDMNMSYLEFLPTHHHSSSGEMTRLRQTIAYAPLSQSLVVFTIQSIRRLCMLLSTQRSSRGLVGIIHSRISSRSPCAMGWVLHCFSWSPPVSRYNAPQACRVFGSAPGEPFCLWVHTWVQQPSIVRGSPS
jgi:hypothetical protein